MYRLIECLTQEHHYGLLAVAIAICVAGASLTALIARRIVGTVGIRKRFQTILAALIGGASIWSTHFIAMLAYEPGFPHGYDIFLTAVSLLVAVGGMLGTMTVLGQAAKPVNYILGGFSFGGTVSAMHYVGMGAYQLPGTLTWDPLTVLASVALGSLFGIASLHRFIFPVTQYCWLGGAAFLTLAICSMHFVGMTAFTFELSPYVLVPEKVVSDTTLGIFICGVTITMFVIGFIGINIEDGAEIDAREKIEQTATIDPLTGLHNRLALTQELSNCKALMSLDKMMNLAVLTIDLDRFKEVNDLHGHSNGDAVLTTIATRLFEKLVEGEFVARAGGDEFVAIKKGFRRQEEIQAFATRLYAAFFEPIDLSKAVIFIEGSIGIATTLNDGSDVDGLLQKSDLAMYRAKVEVEQSICFFDKEMGQLNRKRLLLINDLRQAIARKEFQLVYQLQNEVASGKPSGFEVLLRWNHSERGRVSPAEFIPLAEETGLIREIGLWVLREACIEAAKWNIPYPIAVNVSPQQLVQPSFLEQVSDALIESGLEPERLELEVTEASIIDDQENTLRVMHQIKDMGLRIAMDDFGTGYSSLATLQAFPFDKIKIDRSFVQDVHLNKQRAAIVRATLLLGEALTIPVLAEGVEFEDELKFLKEAECEFVQGFFFGHPMAVEEVRQLTQRVLIPHVKSA